LRSSSCWCRSSCRAGPWPAARLLQLEIPPVAEPAQRLNLDIPGHLEREIAAYPVMPGAVMVDRRLRDFTLPAETHITAIVRGDDVLMYDPDLRLLPGDLVYVFTDPTHIPERLEEHRFYGDFVLDGGAQLNDVADMYGLELAPARENQTLAQFLGDRFHQRPVAGDIAVCGKADLVVRETHNGQVTKVGLRVRRQ
jgi:potassium/hydrogen antiporter